MFPVAICPAAKTTDDTTAQSQNGKHFIPFPRKNPRYAISSPNAAMIT